MLEKFINKIIQTSQCYLALRDKANKLESDIDDYQEEIKRLNNIVLLNKTTARKIVRAVNSLIKKDEIVNTQKEIKALCNKIIKGE